MNRNAWHYETEITGTNRTELSTLTLVGLNTKHTAANNALTAVTAANTAYINAVNARLEPFKTLSTLATRIVNALDATDASNELVKDAKTLQRKFTGSRAKQPAQPLQEGDPMPLTISVSQRSYDQLLQHIINLVDLAASEPSYSPNETELQIATLLEFIETLRVLNQAVTNSWTTISNARLNRNHIFYDRETGMLAIAQESKNYVRSVFGAKAPETKQITAIRYYYVKT